MACFYLCSENHCLLIVFICMNSLVCSSVKQVILKLRNVTEFQAAVFGVFFFFFLLKWVCWKWEELSLALVWLYFIVTARNLTLIRSVTWLYMHYGKIILLPKCFTRLIFRRLKCPPKFEVLFWYSYFQRKIFVSLWPFQFLCFLLIFNLQFAALFDKCSVLCITKSLTLVLILPSC